MTTTTTMQLEPYVFFYGRCVEALEFYKSVFGGSYEATRTGDTPMAAKVPPQAHDRIMHATFKGPGFSFMCSDGMDDKKVDSDAGNICLCVSMPEGANGDAIFKALGAGGTVGMPLDKAFWGGRFGSVTDRFGTEWFVHIT